MVNPTISCYMAEIGRDGGTRAAGKDPGLNPQMLLELLERKGRVTADDFRRLDLREALDPTVLHGLPVYLGD